MNSLSNYRHRQRGFRAVLSDLPLAEQTFQPAVRPSAG
jgi:hypothetical protein